MSEQKLVPGTNVYSLIEKDMQDSYLRYSMSVIVSRALPDVRDGLKPVHRRVLFGMHDLGVYPGKAYKKSARIVGDVIGKYHPHGDIAVYDTLVRMAQDFSLRYPLVDGQGNFGSIDGDSAAAMRYTEARMTRFGEMMLEDLDKDTVDFGLNYDDSLKEPLVIPSSFPNLIVNGSTGIAVGMATSMAPHNLREVTQAIHAVAKNPEIADEELLAFVTGPDFPTGGIICGRAGIRDAYLTGRGKVRVRARVHTEEASKGRERIVITEIPYMVNKAKLVEKIADLVKEKKVEGISDIRDESDRSGMRVVLELRKDAIAEVILNNLYKYTQLQDTFGIYNLALVNKQPTLLTLKKLIELYLEHRIEVIRRRTEFELKKAKARMHILEGLRIAQQNIDEVVRIIRASQDTDIAKKSLIERFDLSEIQAQSIVDMRLRQLTNLEIDKIENEYQELVITAADLEDILAKRERQLEIILNRLDEINDKFGDERRTSIEEDAEDFEYEDLIPEEEQVITLSHEGYVRRLPIDTFKAQNRGGKGIIGAGLKDEDFVEQIFTASTHSYLLIFTNKGRVHWTKVYRLPEGSRSGKGRPIVNFIELVEDETVSAIVPVRNFEDHFYLIFATKNGVVNKMKLELFSNVRRKGVNAITLDENDELVKVRLVELLTEDSEEDNTDESNTEDVVEEVVEEEGDEELVEDIDSTPIANDLIMISTRLGQSITFPMTRLRAMGRGTRGVRGISLAESDEVISLLWLKPGSKVLTITENGYGKRSLPSTYRVTHRGGKGVRNLNVTDKTGNAVFVESVADDYDLMISSRDGQVIRIQADSIRVTGRFSQGVKAITLREGDLVQDAAALPRVEDDQETLQTSELTDTETQEIPENPAPSESDTSTDSEN